MSEDFAGQRTLVTGATGFVGGHVVRRLVREGAAVRALVRDPARAGDLAASGVELVRGDVRDPASLAAAVQGCSWVFHFAGIVDDFAPEAEYRAINVEGTRAMAEAALGAGVKRFVHISTIAVYGFQPGTGIDEETPSVLSEDAYSDTKLEAEQIVRRLVKERQLPAVVAQPNLAYGPGDAVWTLGPLGRIRSGLMMLPGGGTTLLHPIYIDDLVEGILAVARKGRTGERYILCGPQAVTVKEYFTELARLAGKRSVPGIPVWAAFALADITTALARLTRSTPMATRAQVRWLTTSRSYSGRKAQAELGFTAATDLKTGMRRTEEWLRETGVQGKGHAAT